MRSFSFSFGRLVTTCLSFGFAVVQAAPVGSTLQYNPTQKVVQGDQPLTTTYPLAVTTPGNFPATGVVTVDVQFALLAKPAGVSEAVALSFISGDVAQLTFNGPNQTRTVNVTVAVPEGEYAGNYQYKITTAGWPANSVTDPGATVNAIVDPPSGGADALPAVVIQTPGDGTEFVYRAADGPLAIAIAFEATVAADGLPITGLTASVDGVPLPVTVHDLESHAASGTATFVPTHAGTFTIEVQASNDLGASTATVDVTVTIEAAPPTVMIVSPADGSVYPFVLGGTTVPIAIEASSAFGNITGLSALLNGVPLDLALDGIDAALDATGTVTLLVPPGTHTLTAQAESEHGIATASSTFTVVGTAPPPTIALLAPTPETTFTRVAGDPPTLVPFAFIGGTDYGAITAVSVTLNGAPVSSYSVNGLGSSAIDGAGTLPISSGGTYTLVVTADNGNATASAQVVFTVREQSSPFCGDVTWQPPVSLNKVVQGGSTLPIKFTLGCGKTTMRDPRVLVAIYEIFPDGSASNPTIYPHGTGSPHAPDYTIAGNHYQLNFVTANGAHRYRIEVYYPLSADGWQLQLLGTKEIFTR